MSDDPQSLLAIAFEAAVISWRGPSPFFFLAIPQAHAKDIGSAARLASYGWGVVPVEATIGDLVFQTSLFPRGETYLLPLRALVRKQARVSLGDIVAVEMRIQAPSML